MGFSVAHDLEKEEEGCLCKPKANLWITTGEYGNIKMKELKAEIPVNDTMYSSAPYDEVPEKNEAPMKLCSNKKKEAIIEENIHHHNARPHWGVFKGKRVFCIAWNQYHQSQL